MSERAAISEARRTGIYDSHYVIDRNSSGTREAVRNGDVGAAAERLVSYLRRTDRQRRVSLYEEKTTHRVEWREVPDPWSQADE